MNAIAKFCTFREAVTFCDDNLDLNLDIFEQWGRFIVCDMGGGEG